MAWPSSTTTASWRNVSKKEEREGGPPSHTQATGSDSLPPHHSIPAPPLSLSSFADGWGYSQLARGGGMPPPTADFGGGAPPAGVLARQAIEFLHAVTYLRVPLIPINAAVVLVKLVFG